MSQRPVIIGIDAGTSMIKAVAFDGDGRQLAVAARPNSYETLPDGGAVQDLPRTWNDAVAVLGDLVAEVDRLGGTVAAIGVTGQGDGTWLIDRDGLPVGKGWLWLDSRTAGQVERLRGDGTGARVYGITGCGITVCQQGMHLLWMKRHEPETLARATTAFHCKDWLHFRLTGVRATDTSEGTSSFGDFSRRAYDPAVLEALGIADLARLLPPMLDGTRESHPLAAEAARAIGLPAGTPVVLGNMDVVCTGLGGGLYDASRPVGCTVLGSTGMHMRIAHRAADVGLNDGQAGYVMPFPVPGTWAQMHSNMAATLNIDWIVDRAVEAAGWAGVQKSRREMLAEVDARVAAAEPGRVLYHPYIHEAGERGPFVDAHARAQFLGLSTRAGLADLARAVYEGLSFAARDCYLAMGEMPVEVRIAGGAARSATLRRILAAVLGTPVRTSSRDEAGAAGVAMMAAVQQGHYPDMAACCAAWVDPLLGEPEAPDPELAARYAALFPLYLRGSRQMRELWRELDGVHRAD
ncbi:MAG: FGGY-family carbohydrate kinase [Geminicoccaceae bacterium]